MSDDLLLLLGPEGDRLDAYAAIHGGAASLALAVQRWTRARGASRRIARQARGLNAVATAFASAFRLGDAADIDELAALMARVAPLERRGIPHDQLITMPRAWPLRGLPLAPAALALLAVMRLREGLQNATLAAGDARRATQLRIICDLEAAVLRLALAQKRHAVTAATALRKVRRLFAIAEPAIGADLVEFLGGAEAIAAAVMATIGCDFRPAS
jgi:hypothetical protein